MAELETQKDTENKKLQSQRFLLPLLIGTTICIIIGCFIIGYNSLTSISQPPDDTTQVIDAEMQETEVLPGENASDNSTDMTVNEDGTFDFAKYRYFTFPLPFVTNFVDGNGLVTVEIAIATYETTLRGEKLLEKLTTFTPKMRSAINLTLAEQAYENVNTVAKRKILEDKLLDVIRPVIDGVNPDDPSGITDLHFTKFVTSGVR